MIPATQKLYNDQILTEAAKRFGSSMQQTKDLGGFESFVYEIERGDGRQFIMKITHSVRRTKDYLMGELEFVNYLAANGVQTPAAIPSVNGELVEIIEAKEGYFLAYAFEKAEGRLIEVKDWSADLLQEWGRLIGQMHHLTKTYTPSKSSYKREDWHEQELLADCRKIVPNTGEYDAALLKMEELLKEIWALPKTKDSFGLIHSDLHQSNFFLSSTKQILPIDFDDCAYHYFIYDVAVILYHIMRGRNLEVLREKPTETIAFFMEHFRKGYETANHLEEFWWEKLPLFVRERHALFLSVYHQIWAGQEWNEEQVAWMERLSKQVEEGDRLFLKP